MADVLDVSFSGIRSYLKRKPSLRTQENQRLLSLIEQEHIQSRKSYGSPHITASLNQQDIPVGQNRVSRLMRAHGIRTIRKRKYICTTVPGILVRLPRTS